MTCKVICERHKALRPADGTGRYILQDRKGVRCVRYLSSERDCGVHAAAAGSGRIPGTQETEESLQWICQSLLMVGTIIIILLWSDSNYGGRGCGKWTLVQVNSGHY